MCKQFGKQWSCFLLAAALVMTTAVVAEELSDPTRPLGYRQSQGSKPPVELNSILIGEGRRIAVINGQRATEGQQIGDVFVLRILPNRVIVRRDGQQIELKLHSAPTRSNAS